LALIIVATTFSACDVEEDNPVSYPPGDSAVGKDDFYINPTPRIDGQTVYVESNGTYFTGTLTQYHLIAYCNSITFEDFTLDARILGNLRIRSKISFDREMTVTLIGDSHIYYYFTMGITTNYPIYLLGDNASLTLHFSDFLGISDAVKQFSVANGYIMGVSMPEEIAQGDIVVTFNLNKRETH
jgi:hypothetical protein